MTAESITIPVCGSSANNMAMLSGNSDEERDSISGDSPCPPLSSSVRSTGSGWMEGYELDSTWNVADLEPWAAAVAAADAVPNGDAGIGIQTQPAWAAVSASPKTDGPSKIEALVGKGNTDNSKSGGKSRSGRRKRKGKQQHAENSTQAASQPNIKIVSSQQMDRDSKAGQLDQSSGRSNQNSNKSTTQKRRNAGHKSKLTAVDPNVNRGYEDPLVEYNGYYGYQRHQHPMAMSPLPHQQMLPEWNNNYYGYPDQYYWNGPSQHPQQNRPPILYNDPYSNSPYAAYPQTIPGHKGANRGHNHRSTPPVGQVREFYPSQRDNTHKNQPAQNHQQQSQRNKPHQFTSQQYNSHLENKQGQNESNEFSNIRGSEYSDSRKVFVSHRGGSAKQDKSQKEDIRVQVKNEHYRSVQPKGSGDASDVQKTTIRFSTARSDNKGRTKSLRHLPLPSNKKGPELLSSGGQDLDTAAIERREQEHMQRIDKVLQDIDSIDLSSQAPDSS